METERDDGFFGRYKKPLIFIVTFMLCYVVLMTSQIAKKINISVGEIAKYNIKANREVINNIATKAKEKQAEENVPNQYTEKTDVKKALLENIKTLFAKINIYRDMTIEDKEKLSRLKEESPITLKNDSFEYLLKLPKDDLTSMENQILDGMNQVYEGSIKENNTEDIKKAQEVFLSAVAKSNMSSDSKELAYTIGESQIKPNLFYDKEKTEEMKKQAVKNVTPEMIQKNQIVVKEGEPATAEQIQILMDLGVLDDSVGTAWYIYLVIGMVAMMSLYLQWMYLYKYHKENIYDDNRKLILISVITVSMVVISRVMNFVSPFLIPFACGPLLLSILLDYKVSIVISALNILLISPVVDFNVEITIIALVSTIVGSTILKRLQQRNDILYSSIYIAAFNMIITFSMGTLISNNILDVIKKTGYAGIGSVLAAILTIGFLPLFESMFDIVTVIKLLELSNPNNPLMRKLLMEAPGTYHHSVLVANLAELATEAVGGNPVLARIAAYYHDVGKTKRPYFFKENQTGKENPHDKISPNLSTLIITSHVKDGLEMAKENNLPKVIQDVIQQHHGTTLVKYFYYTAKNNAENPEEIKEEDFRYLGPIPQFKESGIIMLADGVEAAVRSISDPTKGKIEEMVNNIIKDKLNTGQLDDCDLTLKDLDRIRESFLTSLNGIYHQRIEYPTDHTIGLKKQGE